MIRFLDGPATGVLLVLHRAPLFLRVVLSADGTWDALDQLDDLPAMDEAIHVYRRVGEAGWVHVDCDRPRRGAWYATGEYRLAAAQPADDVVRDRTRWQEWCLGQAKGLEANP